LAADLAAPVRAKLHRKAAETLAAQHADDPAAPVAEIAHHWLQAGAGAAAEAVDAAARAGRVAMERLAFADAAQLFERATASLAIAAPADTRRRVELMLVHCEALARSGDRARAEVVCRDAAELARSLDDGVLFARVALALGAELLVGHDDPTVKRWLQEALDRLPPGPGPWRARVAARLAGARQPEPDPSGPIEQAREAIAMARALGDDDVLLYALHAGMAAFTDYAPPAERIRLNRETAALAAARGESTYELRARSRILFDCVELLDPTAFATELAALDAVVDRIGVPRYRWMPLMFRAMEADWRGAFDDGERLAREAAELAGPTEGPFRFAARDMMRRQLTDVPLDDEGDHAFVGQATAIHAGLGHLFHAMVHARSGNHDVARAALRQLVTSGELDRVIGVHDAHGVHVLGELVWHLRDRELAARVEQMAAPMAGRVIALSGMGYLLYDTVEHVRARMALVCERWDDMNEHAAAALAQCERLGARTLAAQVYVDWAEGSAAGGDRGRAVELARAGARIAADLGLPRVAARCRAIVDGDGDGAGDAPATGDAARPLALSLDGEYWTVRGLGEVCRMRDSRGMQMLSMLIARPGEELNVLELSGSSPGAGAAVDGGDAGALLDAEARAAYEARLRDLREELDEAEQFNDAGRADRARAEIEALTSELSRAFGLGGRERRAGNAVERARSNVRRRIADAMRKIADAAPAIGEHLGGAVRTGNYCCYDPRG
jgi:hypothetical protein